MAMNLFQTARIFAHFALLGLAILSLASVAAMSTVSDAEASPTKRLLGTWAGRGVARFEGNKSERIKCNAYYTGGGRKLNIAVRCASTSYKIEIRSKLENRSGRLTGTWEERTFNASGQTSGSINDERIRLSINGGGLTASMAVQFNDTEQNIKVRTDGSQLKSVAIDLSRTR